MIRKFYDIELGDIGGRTISDELDKEAKENCRASFKGVLVKQSFLVLLEFIDDMKQRGWEMEIHETDFQNDSVKINYSLIKY